MNGFNFDFVDGSLLVLLGLAGGKGEGGACYQ
jgi:hypothetical protein